VDFFQWVREGVDNVSHISTIFIDIQHEQSVGHCYLPWTLKGGSYPIMPCVLLYFSGDCGRRKAKPSSKRACTVLGCLLMYNRVGVSNAFQKWMPPLQKGFISWKQNQISAFKNLCFKNYGLSITT
jgi:hypothetical protein